MQLQRRRTPCVGICSTTYGDLICRGCKRFAHEIVSWNGYSDSQRDRVWTRLTTLRDGCVLSHLEVTDDSRLQAACADLALVDELSPASLAYEALVRAPADQGLEALGLAALDEDVIVRSTLRERIDAEFYRRSVAHYERNFRASFTT